MKLFNHTIFDHIKNSFRKRKKLILVSTGTTLTLAIIIAGSIFGYSEYYADKIYPNVLVGGINLGGLTVPEAEEVLRNNYESMLNRGAKFSLDGEEKIIELRATGATDPDLIYDLIDFDVDNTVQDAFAIGRTNGNFVFALVKIISPSGVNSHMTTLDEKLAETIHSTFKELEEESEKTSFEITVRKGKVSIEATEGKQGTEIDTEKAIKALYNDAKDFELSTIDLVLIEATDLVTKEEAESLESEVQDILDAAPYKLTHISNSQLEYSWTVRERELIAWLEPTLDEDNNPSLTLNLEEMEDFIEDIRSDIDTPAQNARFTIEDGLVSEFAGSLNGENFNAEQTTSAFITQLGNEDTSMAILVDVVEPEVTTGSVNDFGITEILGVGTSDFAGSPSNRIKNIQNGVSKLNGLLIPSGGTISLIEKLKPFTYENGYLPELVIKGDEIKAEMGGGLCQIGTTTFRATMNAGLEVTERRNHSLVVSYYNDPTNGNPGTDATIYEPAPDYKFTNDTDNYILLSAVADLETMQLVFTFWGTSDGREGYYSPPEVLSWNGYGKTQYKETPDLAPGVEKCQSPHPGATTSFDYFVDYADGTQHKKNYTSTYRSLPRICLVGIGKDPIPEITEDTGGETEIDENAPASEAPEELEVGDIIE